MSLDLTNFTENAILEKQKILEEFHTLLCETAILAAKKHNRSEIIDTDVREAKDFLYSKPRFSFLR